MEDAIFDGHLVLFRDGGVLGGNKDDDTDRRHRNRSIQGSNSQSYYTAIIMDSILYNCILHSQCSHL